MLKDIRKETGLTQSEFAEYYEIPVRTIQEWEQGRRKPPQYIPKLLKRIWNLENATRKKDDPAL